MADLVTHLATVLLPAAFLPRHRALGPLVVGVALPDVLARAVPMALEAGVRLGVPVPDAVILPWSINHEPLPALCWCLALAAAMVPADRRITLLGLAAGVGLHLALDVTQDHHGLGYFLLAPFSVRRLELGWIGSEATVPWAPWLALATAAAWGGRAVWTIRRRIS